MPEPPAGSRPAGRREHPGRGAGPEIRRSPTSRASPPVPSDQPATARTRRRRTARPDPTPEPPAGTERRTTGRRTGPRTPDHAATPPTAAGRPPGDPGGAGRPRWTGPARTSAAPARRAWGESAEPTPPRRCPSGPAGAPDPGRPVGRAWTPAAGTCPPPSCPRPARRRCRYPTPPATRPVAPGRPPRPLPPAPPPRAAGGRTRRRRRSRRPGSRAGRRPGRSSPPPRRRPPPPDAGPAAEAAPPAGEPTAPPAGAAARLAGRPRGTSPVPVRRAAPLAVAAAAHRWPAAAAAPPTTGSRSRPSTRPAPALPDQVADLRLREDDRSRRPPSSWRPRYARRTARRGHLRRCLRHERRQAGDGLRRHAASGSARSPTRRPRSTRLTERYALRPRSAVETGVRGRYERCAVGRADGDAVVVCTSVDHGSIATGVFTRLSVDDSAALLDTLREQIVTPNGLSRTRVGPAPRGTRDCRRPGGQASPGAGPGARAAGRSGARTPGR